MPKTCINQIKTHKPNVQQVLNLAAMCIMLPPVLILFWPKQYPLQVCRSRNITVLASKGRKWQLWLRLSHQVCSKRTFSCMPEDDQVCLQRFLGTTCRHGDWEIPFARQDFSDPSGSDGTCQLYYFLGLIKGSVRQTVFHIRHIYELILTFLFLSTFCLPASAVAEECWWDTNYSNSTLSCSQWVKFKPKWGGLGWRSNKFHWWAWFLSFCGAPDPPGKCSFLHEHMIFLSHQSSVH